jgi:flagellar biosynthesis/type III secretory pathway M-ring protein FliF/YscJ
MDQIRQAMANIQVQIGKMTASQKLLIASLVVIALMTLFVVSQYAAKPSMVDLMAADGQVDMVRTLQGGGFDAQVVDGRVVVPDGQERYALAYLSESGQLPGDTTLLFSNLIGSQDWKASSSQHRQQFNIALQNELSRVISEFNGIHRATVILDIPQASGLGRAARAATASVSLFTRSGGPISQDMVDASARLVAGAVAGLSPASVQVIDGTTGRARTSSDDASQSSSRYLEYATQVEKHTQRKIEDLFGHVPGVVVSITARVDITKVESVENSYMPKDEGTVSLPTTIKTTNKTTQEATRSAEPGVRSNQTASINNGPSTGASNSDETSETQSQVAIGQRTKNTFDPRGTPTHLSASVIIPQEYIESIIERSRPVVEGEESAPVTYEEADSFFSTYRTTIESLIQPHLLGVSSDGQSTQGSLTVSMAPIGASLVAGGVAPSMGMLGSLAGGSGPLGSTGGLIEKGLILLLAVISLGMMAMMVKRSSNKIELPAAEELVGVPPHLETDGDIVGEASEGDHVMTGIEIDEQLLEVQHLRDQVSELIAQNPESAASLVERWAEHAE